jgi:hypothetical protein
VHKKNSQTFKQIMILFGVGIKGKKEAQ